MWVARTNLFEILFLVFISLIYLGLALYHLNLPGAFGFETGEASLAIQVLKHQKTDILSLMYIPYVGPIDTYSLLPFFALFGVSIYSLRFATIFYGLIALIFFYLFSKQLFNRWIAMISVILLALSPTFIFYNRQGLFTNSVILLPLFGSLYFFLLGLIKKKAWCYYIGFIFMGIGCTTKLSFWWTIPQIIFLFILNRKRIILSWLDYIFCFIFFCIGSFPIILYNLKTGFGTFTFLFYNRMTDYNFNLLYIFITRFNNFKELIQGSLDMFYFGIHQGNTLIFILFIISFFSLFILILSRKNENHKNNILFILIFISSVLLESLISPSYMTAAHLFMLLPFVVLTISVLFYKLYNKTTTKILIVIVLLIVIFINVKIILNFHSFLKKTGGTLFMSDSIYDVADYLEKNQIMNPLFSYSFVQDNLYFLSNGRIYRKDNNELNCKSQKNQISDSQLYYISYAGDIWISKNVTFELEKVFYDRSSKPGYLLFKIYDSHCDNNQRNKTALHLSNPDDTKVIRLYYCSDCIAQYQLMDNIDQKMLKLIYSITKSKNKRSSILYKIFENIFLGNPESGFIFLRHDYKYLNFSNYSSINVYVRSDDNQTGGMEFQIKESEGDAWYYFDNTSLSATNWTLIHMPFENFTSPSWAQMGNGKKTFTEIKLIGITLTSFNIAINKTVYFKTFGDQIFFLN